jgi:aryl-alcohol dehydrogenase-like predicted oxidoreductase
LVLSEDTPIGREDGMQTVTLGTTGLEVTPLAYGTWQCRGPWGPVDGRAAIEAIQHARSLGIRFFDTAQAYGFGHVTETRAARC